MFLGSFIKKDNVALMALVALLIFIGLGGGIFVQVSDQSNYFVQAMGFISPIRYGNCLLLKRLMKDVFFRGLVLDFTHLDVDENRCLI